LAATSGNAQATITFLAPTNNGGSVITGYTVISSPAGGVDSNAGSTSLSHVVTGLVNGTSYTFTATATNAVGTSTPSTVSNSVVPSTVPGVPTIGTATAGIGSASITFTAPASNGGSNIINYLATAYINGVSTGITGNGTSSPVTVNGLTNGTAYTFEVQAENAVGYGSSSGPSNSVTPSAGTGVPNAPSVWQVNAGYTSIVTNIHAPTTLNGTITQYTATASPSGISGVSTGSRAFVVIEGLPAGVPQTVTATATNAAGTGPASVASASVTPLSTSGVWISNEMTVGAVSPWQTSYTYQAETTVPTGNSSAGAGVYSLPFSNTVSGTAGRYTQGNGTVVTMPTAGPTGGTTGTMIVVDTSTQSSVNGAANGGVQPYYGSEKPWAYPGTSSNGCFDLTPFTYLVISVWPTIANQTINFYCEESPFWWGTAGAGTNATTIVDPAANWTTNEWVGYYAQGMNNPLNPPAVKVTSNTSNTLTLASSLSPACTTGTDYILQESDFGVGANAQLPNASWGPATMTVDAWNTYRIPLTAFNGTQNGLFTEVSQTLILKIGMVNQTGVPSTMFYSNVGFQ
jgi:hypothetical protein